ncbi:HNH endonuclease signature motif containing protein [Metabacillus indicus]|uniref:HNH endonuclease signature motif containing protein n=1 Tax=Metabacillus indicus TaxID=246786 RepID=UPI003CEB8777
MNEPFIQENFNRLPIQMLAKKINVDVIELCKWLRRKGYFEELQPIEMQYIVKQIEKMPIDEIQESLGLSATQFYQIRQRFNLLKKQRYTNEYTEEEVLNKSRWLIEEKMALNIDDLLPKTIRAEHFNKNELYPILKYGELKKKTDPYFKYFSAVAFLVCKAYPNEFKPYQFPHSNVTKQYFTKKNYLRELRWIIENKLGLEEEFLINTSMMNSFLTKKELDLYGLGYHTYKHIFKEKKALIKELVRSCKVMPREKNATTKELRATLFNVGIKTEKCYIDGCTEKNIEIHHIIPKRYRNFVSFNVDDAFNLMPLCENHHISAARINVENLPNQNREIWRELVKKRMEAFL